jgi:hypothetical protein
MTERAKRLKRLEKQIGRNRRGCDEPVPEQVIIYIPDNGRDTELSLDSGPAVPGKTRVIIYDPVIGIGQAG